MHNRRDVLGMCMAGSALGLSACGATAPTASMAQHGSYVESQRGDPFLPPEHVDIDLDAIEQLLARANRDLLVPKRDDRFGFNLYDLAAQHVGVSRQANQRMVTQYLQLVKQPFQGSSGPVPFCAAGVAYVAAQNYVRMAGGQLNNMAHLHEMMRVVKIHHFFPSASVVNLKVFAESQGQWVRFSDGSSPRRGWLAVFDFGKGRPEHVGIVGGIEQNQLRTVEFNTSDRNNSNGGSVAHKLRKLDGSILGYIKT